MPNGIIKNFKSRSGLGVHITVGHNLSPDQRLKIRKFNREFEKSDFENFKEFARARGLI